MEILAILEIYFLKSQQVSTFDQIYFLKPLSLLSSSSPLKTNYKPISYLFTLATISLCSLGIESLIVMKINQVPFARYPWGYVVKVGVPPGRLHQPLTFLIVMRYKWTKYLRFFSSYSLVQKLPIFSDEWWTPLWVNLNSILPHFYIVTHAVVTIRP